jgi:hypothetical protein
MNNIQYLTLTTNEQRQIRCHQLDRKFQLFFTITAKKHEMLGLYSVSLFAYLFSKIVY